MPVNCGCLKKFSVCCPCKLNVLGYIAGWLGIMGRIIIIAFLSTTLAALTEFDPSIYSVFLTSLLTYFSVSLLINFIFIYGIHVKKRHFFLPYLTTVALEMSLGVMICCGIIILLFAINSTIAGIYFIFVTVLVIGAHFTLWLYIIILYKEMEFETRVSGFRRNVNLTGANTVCRATLLTMFTLGWDSAMEMVHLEQWVRFMDNEELELNYREKLSILKNNYKLSRMSDYEQNFLDRDIQTLAKEIHRRKFSKVLYKMMMNMRLLEIMDKMEVYYMYHLNEPCPITLKSNVENRIVSFFEDQKPEDVDNNNNATELILKHPSPNLKNINLLKKFSKRFQLIKLYSKIKMK